MSVNVRCPDCSGEAHLPDAAVRLLRTSNGLRYCWQCPDCSGRVYRTASAEVVRLLHTAGITVEVVMPPNPSPRPQGPVLTEDDLISLGLDLEAS